MEDYIKKGLKKLIREAAATLDRTAFQQEPSYTAAFFGRLYKKEIISPSGQYLRFEGVPSTERGPGAAEQSTGIDIGIVLTWEDEFGNRDEKAVLIQAKNEVSSIPAGSTAGNNLAIQTTKMLDISEHSAVMECPSDCSEPRIYNAVRASPGWEPPPVTLGDFLVDKVLACSFGDFEPEIVARARRADRALVILTNAPVPRNKPAWKLR